MSIYVEIIKDAFVFFPLVALFISVPFVLFQYHKFGSIHPVKVMIIYSFILYLICAYFLVILPLPDMDKVSKLVTPKVQLIPFLFLKDIVNYSSFNIFRLNTYLNALKESYIFIPLYNIFLTIPFGIYLRYYFNYGIKKTFFYTFLLSLFFEITQITGLYFIYPRGYRLFDVDDLILNTLGGIIGYFISYPVIKLLPSRKIINEHSKEKGRIVSGFRRTTSFIMDLLCVLLISYFVKMYVKTDYYILLIPVLYYIFIPLFLKGSTVSEKYLNIKVTNLDEKFSFIKLVLRKFMFVFLYVGFPYTLSYILFKYIIVISDIKVKFILFGMYLMLMFLYIFITIVKYVFSSSRLLYEKLSMTKLISTIK